MSTFWKFASWTARRHARLGHPLGKMAIPLFGIGPAQQMPAANHAVQEPLVLSTDSPLSVPQLAKVAQA